MALSRSIPVKISYFSNVPYQFLFSVGFPNENHPSYYEKYPVIKNKGNLTTEITKSMVKTKFSSAQLFCFI